MGFFGKLWARLRGMFIGAGDDLVSSSPEAIRATYAAAIDDAKRRYKEMEQAVAMLARERDRTETLVKDLEKEEAELQRKLEGSLAAAEADPNNPIHREAGTRYLARIKEIGEKQTSLVLSLDTERKKVEDYKLRLRSFTDEIGRLQKEQGEMVAEFVSTRQVIQLEDRLKGLGESSVDESIVAIRERVAAMRSHAKIATEMSTATVEAQDRAYEQMGVNKEAASKFDELLKARTSVKAGVSDKERELG